MYTDNLTFKAVAYYIDNIISYNKTENSVKNYGASYYYKKYKVFICFDKYCDINAFNKLVNAHKDSKFIIVKTKENMDLIGDFYIYYDNGHPNNVDYLSIKTMFELYFNFEDDSAFNEILDYYPITKFKLPREITDFSTLVK